ncbi:hypothetical protein U3516DRAFT_752973 [Neocallimastix sp. 'constans']
MLKKDEKLKQIIGIEDEKVNFNGSDVRHGHGVVVSFTTVTRFLKNGLSIDATLIYATNYGFKEIVENHHHCYYQFRSHKKTFIELPLKHPNAKDRYRKSIMNYCKYQNNKIKKKFKELNLAKQYGNLEKKKSRNSEILKPMDEHMSYKKASMKQENKYTSGILNTNTFLFLYNIFVHFFIKHNTSTTLYTILRVTLWLPLNNKSTQLEGITTNKDC